MRRNHPRRLNVTRYFSREAFWNWQLDDDEAVAVVRFGPFDEPVTFDHYAIFDGDEPMIVISEEGTARFPPGFDWDWQLSIDVLG